MIILDDAVVNQRHLMILVGMGVLLSYPSMGGPAGVADTAVGDVPKLLYLFAQGRHFPHGLYQVNLKTIVKIGDTSAVIAAVF